MLTPAAEDDANGQAFANFVLARIKRMYKQGRLAGPQGYAKPREGGSRKGASEVIGLSRFASILLVHLP